MELVSKGMAEMKEVFSGKILAGRNEKFLRIEDGDKLGSWDEREGKGNRDDETTAFACQSRAKLEKEINEAPSMKFKEGGSPRKSIRW